MKVTLHTDYALRLLTFLLLSDQERVSTREIAETYDISLSHLNKVSQRLVQLGLLDATRGRGGGVKLTQHAHSSPLGDLVRSLEPNTELAACSGQGALEPCKLAPSCKLRAIFGEAAQAFYDHLNQFTLGDLVAANAQQMRGLLSLVTQA